VRNLVSYIEGEKWADSVPNRVLRRIFVSKRDEVTVERRKLHN
jgi:hypothetical protein